MNITDFADLLNKFEGSRGSNKEFLLNYAFNPEFECKYGFSDDVVDEAVSFLEFADVAGVEEIKEVIEKINKWRFRYFQPDYTGMEKLLS